MELEGQAVGSLLQELCQLRKELQEANSIIDAIKHGEVDALLMSDEQDDRVYILKGADHIYRAFVEQMCEGCAVVATDGVITFCNNSFAAILKTPLEGVMGSSISSVLEPQDWSALSSYLLTRKGSFMMDCILKKSTPVIISASAIAIEGDTYACVTVTDLTEQRRSERFAQLMFKQAHDPILACDTHGRISQANPAAVNMFGAQLVGNCFDTTIPLFRASDGSRIGLSQAIDFNSYGTETLYERSDGRQLTLLIKASNFNAEDKNDPTGSVVMLADVTDTYLLAAEMTRLDRLDVIGAVAAGIGHEVRNPLTTVRGYLQLFTQKEKYADDLQPLKLMIEELDRANLIITDFLSMAKGQPITLKPGNLNDTINTVFPLLQADAFRLGHEIKVIAGEIDFVCYDDKEIRQLIFNLVRNSLEAMVKPGVVRIETHLEGETVVLAVQDCGCGIPNEVLNKLGTPFLTTKPSGTGLGLAVCFRIASGHGARIEVKSSSEGTTVFVKFKAYVP